MIKCYLEKSIIDHNNRGGVMKNLKIGVLFILALICTTGTSYAAEEENYDEKLLKKVELQELSQGVWHKILLEVYGIKVPSKKDDKYEVSIENDEGRTIYLSDLIQAVDQANRRNKNWRTTRIKIGGTEKEDDE